MDIYKRILAKKAAKQKSLALLIDPDGHKSNDIGTIVDLANEHHVDYFFVGGSLILDDQLDDTIRFLKRHTDIPVILFPGGETQIHKDADALLLLSLVSGRNPEYLISKHVIAAPKIKKMGLEAISTGYMLIHGFRQSSASYISGTLPIPPDKHDIIKATALASQYLGHKMIYLEGGSGTPRPVSTEVVQGVRELLDIPIIVGGGIKNADQMTDLYKSGADIIVIGTSIEKRPQLVQAFAQSKASYNHQLSLL